MGVLQWLGCQRAASSISGQDLGCRVDPGPSPSTYRSQSIDATDYKSVFIFYLKTLVYKVDAYTHCPKPCLWEDSISLLSLKVTAEWGYSETVLHFQLLPTYQTDPSVNQSWHFLSLSANHKEAPCSHSVRWRRGVSATLVDDMGIRSSACAAYLCLLPSLYLLPDVLSF